MTRIELAQKFAHDAHDSIHQVRKYTHEPYWVHTDAVAAKVATVPNVNDDMIIAAHLHDVEEDVAPSKKVILDPESYGLPKEAVYYYDITAIATIFGKDVAHYVLDLTDQFTKENYPTWNRDKRKSAERSRMEHTSPEVKTIKLADLINNTESIVKDDPDFAHVYLREKMSLLGFLADGYPPFLQEASLQTINGFMKLGMPLTIYG